MGIGDRISKAATDLFGAEEKAVPIVAQPGFEAYALGGAYGLTMNGKQRAYLEELKGWVGAGVSAISDEIAATELKLFKYTKDGVEEVDDHPVLDLLFKVNDFTTKFDHFWLTQSYLELTGEAPWYVEREGATVKNVYLLRPDRLLMLPNTQGGKSDDLIGGYQYRSPAGVLVNLEPNEVIFLKYPNPAKPFRGLGTLEQAIVTVDIDAASEAWNKQFYTNSARPDGILTVNAANMTDDQKKKLKVSLKEAYEGTKNAHKVMVLWGDMKFDKSSFTVKDMDFLEQQKFTRDKILGILRVPKAIVAQTDGVNLASAEVAQYTFARWTIKPKLERLIQQLNEFLLPMFPDTENLFIDYVNPVPEDETKKVAKYTAAINTWMTINEVREEEGLEDIEGGDVLYIAMNLTPLEPDPMNPQLPAKTPPVDPNAPPVDPNADPAESPDKTPKPPKSDPAKEPKKMYPVGRVIKRVSPEGKRYVKHYNKNRIYEMKARSKQYFKIDKMKVELKGRIKKALREEMRGQSTSKVMLRKNYSQDDDGGARRVLSDEEIKTFWGVKNSIYKNYVTQMRDALVSQFQDQRKATLKKLYAKKEFKRNIKAEDLSLELDLKKEQKKTLKITLPLIEALFSEAGQRTYELLNLEQEMLITAAIHKMLTEQTLFMAKGVVETTNDAIKAQLELGLSKGESVNDIANRMKDVFNSAEDFRAERIARTETLRFNTLSTETAFQDSGIVEAKEWVTDGNPCPFCISMQGKVAALGANFLSVGDKVLDRTIDYSDVPAPPLHPNCECDLIPVFKSEKEIHAAEQKQSR